jgi:hypothetical protein
MLPATSTRYRSARLSAEPSERSSSTIEHSRTAGCFEPLPAAARRKCSVWSPTDSTYAQEWYG